MLFSRLNSNASAAYASMAAPLQVNNITLSMLAANGVTEYEDDVNEYVNTPSTPSTPGWLNFCQSLIRAVSRSLIMVICTVLIKF